MLSVGIVSSVFGPICFSIGIYAIYSKRTAKVRQAIAEESIKYSSRSPTPCSWRLDITRYWFESYGYNNNNLLYQVGTQFFSALKSSFFLFLVSDRHRQFCSSKQ